MLLLTISVPLLLKMPPPNTFALLPDKVLLLTVRVPVLSMPPPELGAFPLAMVRPEMAAFEEVDVNMVPTADEPPPETVKRFAPGPTRSRLPVMDGSAPSALLRLMVPITPAAKAMSADPAVLARVTASRSEQVLPVPLVQAGVASDTSVVVVTMR